MLTLLTNLKYKCDAHTFYKMKASVDHSLAGLHFTVY